MNNLKFRAWHKLYKEYYHVVSIKLDDKIVTIYNGNDIGSYHFDEVIIEQYTGLKDINGKEIYKGDILYCTDINDYLTLSYKKGVLILEDINEEDYPLFYYLHDIEVVGNIHENKEMLL